MHDNNVRLFFDDSSVAPFPLNDWKIVHQQQYQRRGFLFPDRRFHRADAACSRSRRARLQMPFTSMMTEDWAWEPLHPLMKYILFPGIHPQYVSSRIIPKPGHPRYGMWPGTSPTFSYGTPPAEMISRSRFRPVRRMKRLPSKAPAESDRARIYPLIISIRSPIPVQMLNLWRSAPAARKPFFQEPVPPGFIGTLNDYPVRITVNNQQRMELNNDDSVDMNNGASLTAGGVWTRCFQPRIQKQY